MIRPKIQLQFIEIFNIRFVFIPFFALSNKKGFYIIIVCSANLDILVFIHWVMSQRI